MMASVKSENLPGDWIIKSSRLQRSLNLGEEMVDLESTKIWEEILIRVESGVLSEEEVLDWELQDAYEYLKREYMDKLNNP